MGMRELEASILAELKEVAKNHKLRQKDIQAWNTGNFIKPEDGETVFYLPRLNISVCVKIPAKPAKKGKADA
jgi:hypothetical protein